MKHKLAYAVAGALLAAGAAAEDSIAAGEFDVRLMPQADEDYPAGRMLIHKTFRGDLSGEAIGQMLSAGAEPVQSGVYVAVEHVTATLDGREGTFALYHTGVMSDGVPSLSIRVVPGSGTDELSGIDGAMTIDITGGKHFYELTYTLPGEHAP